MILFWILLTISVASLIKGITGFGFALIALPPLLIWYTPTQIIPVLLLCNLFSSTIIVLQKKDRNLIPKKIIPLIISGTIFTLLGVVTLKQISENTLIHMVSIVFIILIALSLIKLKSTINYSRISYPIVGAIVGFLAGCTSVSGPPLAIFLNTSNTSNQQFREIFSWFNIITSIVAIVGYYFVDMITIDTLKTFASFVPILYIGSFVGKRLVRFIPANTFKKYTLLISLASCLMLLFK